MKLMRNIDSAEAADLYRKKNQEYTTNRQNRLFKTQAGGFSKLAFKRKKLRQGVVNWMMWVLLNSIREDVRNSLRRLVDWNEDLHTDSAVSHVNIGGGTEEEEDEHEVFVDQPLHLRLAGSKNSQNIKSRRTSDKQSDGSIHSSLKLSGSDIGSNSGVESRDNSEYLQAQLKSSSEHSSLEKDVKPTATLKMSRTKASADLFGRNRDQERAEGVDLINIQGLCSPDEPASLHTSAPDSDTESSNRQAETNPLQNKPYDFHDVSEEEDDFEDSELFQFGEYGQQDIDKETLFGGSSKEPGIEVISEVQSSRDERARMSFTHVCSLEKSGSKNQFGEESADLSKLNFIDNSKVFDLKLSHIQMRKGEELNFLDTGNFDFTDCNTGKHYFLIYFVVRRREI